MSHRDERLSCGLVRWKHEVGHFPDSEELCQFDLARQSGGFCSSRQLLEFVPHLLKELCFAAQDGDVRDGRLVQIGPGQVDRQACIAVLDERPEPLAHARGIVRAFFRRRR